MFLSWHLSLLMFINFLIACKLLLVKEIFMDFCLVEQMFAKTTENIKAI